MADFAVIVEKTEQTKPISFSYQILLSCLEQDGNNSITVSFDEDSFASSNRYIFKKRIRAKEVRNTEGYMEMIADSFQLMIGQETKKDIIYGKFKICITDIDIRQAIIKDYYRTAMEDIIKDTYEQPIYLARLKVIRAGDTYVIEEVENMPYKQYVWNNVLTATMEAMRFEQMLPAPYSDCTPMNSIQERQEVVCQNAQIHTGSIVIDLGIGGVFGQRFCSEEIIHGLGIGEVFISLGVSQEVQSRKQGIFGNPGVFEDTGCPKVELAAKADMERGSFIIGIKCLEQIDAKRLKVYWMAVKDNAVQQKEEKYRHLVIQPDIVNLQIRESHYFEARIDNEVQKHINWSVKEPEGGTVDSNGYYTAPNQSGVYEVIAKSMEDEGFTATAFVIVRDVF